eukprot:CAMPEP_0194200430 /NCGR_PEP_ID=MMETSP0156-20130528/1037_1 /TAXON_ID=33649 /ORGANISM="Thalassionema nitzschioides, Strain L26-B" /LENGTH=293 /DNA_ID=CAMNT_0038925421 /DNA_START=44 /DNA_END=925 /DNA_ORIENTATION=+
MKVILVFLSISPLLVCALQSSRRFFVESGIASVLTVPSIAWAGIDVSGLAVEGGSTNPAIRDQLKTYDGSATSRVQELQQAKPTPSEVKTSATGGSQPTLSSSVASFAIRYGSFTRLSRRGLAAERFLYEDYVINGNSNGRASVEFEFPSDWLQLDKMSGGIQYVDQRNGDKLYLLTVVLPEGETLETVPKKYFGNVIFDSNGAIARSGTTIDDYKVGRSEMLNPNRRRLTLKYATVTGNGLLVERRGLVDAQVVNGQVYMLMTSSNAAKFEAKGIERDTVESIVQSFRCDRL